MTEITVNIDDYLDSEEKQRLCAEAFTYVARQKAKDDLERMLSNSSYALVFKAVDEVMDGKALELIREKAVKCIAELSNFYIFRKADVWQKEKNVAQEALDSAIKENSNLIRERVAQVFKELNMGDFSAKVNELIYEVINDRLIGKQL
jgi:hypothetical protein